jgi:hypothetical protein
MTEPEDDGEDEEDEGAEDVDEEALQELARLKPPVIIPAVDGSLFFSSSDAPQLQVRCPQRAPLGGARSDARCSQRLKVSIEEFMNLSPSEMNGVHYLGHKATSMYRVDGRSGYVRTPFRGLGTNRIVA